MTYKKEPYNQIAELLDCAEIMPEYIVSEKDETETFAKNLQAIAETFPELGYILKNFNSDSVPYK